MEKIKLVIWLLCLCYTTFAQHKHSEANIVGHVVEKETDEHLATVHIHVEGTTLGTITDASGHYSLINLPIGRIKITASAVGFVSQTIDTILHENKTIEINFALETDLVMLHNIVISANRNATDRKTASSIVNVVGTQMLEQIDAACMADGLNFQSGVRVETSCQNCGSSQVRINGLEGTYTQILIDSRAINSALSSVYGLEQIPTNMIERIEVIKGGTSAAFGSNAVAGVINVITKEPIQNSFMLSHTSSLIGLSKYETHTNLNASIVSKNNKAGVTLFAGTRYRMPYDANNDGFSEIGKLNSKNLGFKTFIHTSNYSKLTAEYHTIYEFRRGGNAFEKVPHEADIAEQAEHQIHSGGLNFDWFSKNNKHKLQLYSSLQYIDRNSYYGAGQDLNAYGKTKDLFNINGFQYVYTMNKCWFMPATLTAGTEFSYNNLHDRMTGYNRTLKQKVNIYSLFFQNEWNNKTLSLLFGFRLDKHNFIKNPIFSPRINVRYAPLNWLIVRAGYASGFKAPQAYDEDLHVEAVGGEMSFIQLEKNLKPEHSHSINLSFNFTPKINNCFFDFLLEGFYTNLKNVFVLEELEIDANGNLILERRNASGAFVFGINAEAGIVPMKNLRLQLGFTYQQSRFKELEQWSEDVAPQKKMFHTPDTYGYLTATYTPIKGFDIALSGIYTGKMLIQHYAGYIVEDKEVITPVFWDMNLKLSYDIQLSEQVVLQVNGGMKNIFNSYQKDFDKGELRDSHYIYGPSLPRTIFCGIKFMM